MLASSDSLIHTSRISAAFVDMTNGGVFDLCFHIVDREDGSYTFIFPSIDLTGRMPAILINNKLVANAMNAYFDSVWIKIDHLHDGKKLNPLAFHKLETSFPDLLRSHDYTTIKQRLIDGTK